MDVNTAKSCLKLEVTQRSGEGQSEAEDQQEESGEAERKGCVLLVGVSLTILGWKAGARATECGARSPGGWASKGSANVLDLILSPGALGSPGGRGLEQIS